VLRVGRQKSLGFTEVVAGVAGVTALEGPPPVGDHGFHGAVLGWAAALFLAMITKFGWRIRDYAIGFGPIG
jgi:hypothetical protein